MIPAKHPSRDRLRELQTTLQQHFKARPHVVEVRFFGSLVQGTTDLAASVDDRYAVPAAMDHSLFQLLKRMVALVEERVEAVDGDALGISTAKLLHFIEVELLANENTKGI